MVECVKPDFFGAERSKPPPWFSGALTDIKMHDDTRVSHDISRTYDSFQYLTCCSTDEIDETAMCRKQRQPMVFISAIQSGDQLAIKGSPFIHKRQITEDLPCQFVLSRGLPLRLP
jgi:hypothetical protein